MNSPKEELLSSLTYVVAKPQSPTKAGSAHWKQNVPRVASQAGQKDLTGRSIRRIETGGHTGKGIGRQTEFASDLDRRKARKNPAYDINWLLNLEAEMRSNGFILISKYEDLTDKYYSLTGQYITIKTPVDAARILDELIKDRQKHVDAQNRRELGRKRRVLKEKQEWSRGVLKALRNPRLGQPPSKHDFIEILRIHKEHNEKGHNAAILSLRDAENSTVEMIRIVNRVIKYLSKEYRESSY